MSIAPMKWAKTTAREQHSVLSVPKKDSADLWVVVSYVFGFYLNMKNFP